MKTASAARARRALAAAALATALLPAAAHAYPHPRPLDVRTFRVDVRVVQKTTWTVDHRSYGPCDPSLTGSGTETIALRSRKPVRMTFKHYGMGYVVLGGEKPSVDGVVATKGTVARFGSLSGSATGPECGDNGGSDTGDPVIPDCGTVPVNVAVQVGWVGGIGARRTGLRLGNSLVLPIARPFEHCPVRSAAGSFPDLIHHHGGGRREIVAWEPVADLFDRGYGQQILIGRGTQRVNRDGLRATTTIRWDVRLTDAKGRR